MQREVLPFTQFLCSVLGSGGEDSGEESGDSVSGPGQGRGGSWDFKYMRDSHSDSDDGHFHFLKTQTLCSGFHGNYLVQSS